jgi:hypothetical protein
MSRSDTSDGLTSNKHALGISTFQRARDIVKAILVCFCLFSPQRLHVVVQHECMQGCIRQHAAIYDSQSISTSVTWQ